MPAPFISYSDTCKKFSVEIIVRPDVNNIVMARFKNEKNAAFVVFLQRLIIDFGILLWARNQNIVLY